MVSLFGRGFDSLQLHFVSPERLTLGFFDLKVKASKLVATPSSSTKARAPLFSRKAARVLLSCTFHPSSERLFALCHQDGFKVDTHGAELVTQQGVLQQEIRGGIHCPLEGQPVFLRIL